MASQDSFAHLEIGSLDIRFNLTLILIALLVIWTLALGIFPYYYKNLSPPVFWFMGFAGVVVLGISLLLHASGHAFAAWLLECAPSSATLFVFGEVQDERESVVSPLSETFISLCGPAFSLIVAFIAHLCAVIAKGTMWPIEVIGILEYTRSVNIVIGVFNLFPVLPLDGGRIACRVLFAITGKRNLATRTFAWAGSWFGIFLVIAGILLVLGGSFIGGVWWVLIGIFLRQASALPLYRYSIRKHLPAKKNEALIEKELITVYPEMSLEQFAKEYVYRYHYKMFPVVSNGILESVAFSRAIMNLSLAESSNLKVQDIAATCGSEMQISSDKSWIEALEQMARTGYPRLIAVDSSGRPLGVIALRNMLYAFR